MILKTRCASIDIGNDALKGYFGSLEGKLYIPNVIASAKEERDVFELEKDTMDGLHVKISSPSLTRGSGTFVVGNLATYTPGNEKMGNRSVKAESDQSLIVLLTALAIDATEHFPCFNGIVEANFLLSTGLPLDEVRAKKKKILKQRLMNMVHEVTFLQTPGLQGTIVKISFTDVLVNGEGYAAFLDLTTNDKLQERNSELKGKCLIINDIGGVSTDTAVLLPNGSIDNNASNGTDEGTLKYLQEILNAIDNEHHVKYKSLRHILDNVIKNDKTVLVKGIRKSAKDQIDPILKRAAKAQLDHIETTWDNAIDPEGVILIGGGAVILKEYIKELNQKEEKYKFPLHFIEQDEESVWMISRAYWKALQLYVRHKNLNVASV